MYKSIADFVQLTKTLNLKLSNKGIIVSKEPQAAKAIAKLLKQIGVNYQVGNQTRDLGVNFTFSKRPCIRKSSVKKRIKNVNCPLKKICALAGISRRARIFFSGAGYAKSTWGFQTAGISFTDWVKLEVAAANAAGFKQGRCRYSALCIAYGENGHTLVRATRELFVLWLKLTLPLINNKNCFLDDLSHAW